MVRQLQSLAFVALLSGACAAQIPSSAQANTSCTVAGQSATSESTVRAVLTKSIDAKKVKPGDKVEAKTTQDATAAGTALPKGTKLVGHVEEAKPRAKGGIDSTLTLAFDSAILKNGQTVPFHAVIVAAAAPIVSAPMPDAGMEANGPGTSMNRNAPSTGGPLGGVGEAAGGAVSATGQAAGGVGRDAGAAVGGMASPTVGAAANPNMGATAQTSMGIPGVTLNAAAGNQTNGSVFTSNSKNVKLDSGSTLVLRVTSQ